MALGKKVTMLGRTPVEDFDLQAGGTGLSTAEIVQSYMRKPGHLLATVRFFVKQNVDQVAKGTGISAETVTAYEKGDKEPSLKDLTRLAQHYKADLRVFLEAFGHVSEDASQESLGLAAQFGGELTESEKVDLKALLKSFSRG